MKLILALLFPMLLTSQTYCSPYHGIDRYDVNQDVMFGLGYVACLHSGGVVAEAGTKRVQVGTILMGQGHHNTAYGFIAVAGSYKNFRGYVGPLYRINNDPALLIGRCGIDVQVYEQLYGTISVNQINTNLNYLLLGLKLIM